MNKNLLKQIVYWTLIVIGLIIVFRIVGSIVKGAKKGKEVIYNVNTVKLLKQKVPHILTVQGVLEGDPQVKVYPQVPGKFAKNNVVEGQRVRKNDILVYIDRDIVGQTFELAPVKSPIDGIVTKLYYIDRGDAVSLQMPVAEVANEENIKVVFNLGQDDLLKVHKGQKATIYYINDQALSADGEVYSVPPVIDKDIMAGTVVVKAPNKAGTMKIGMSVNVEIFTEEKECYMVPERAVLLGESESYVYLNRSGRAAKVSVTTGYRTGDMIEISGPFSDGDEVVTDGNFKLYEGASLSVVSQNNTTTSPVEVTATVQPAETSSGKIKKSLFNFKK
jgi:multidrug efflux pump subunit AcrA (membrane-fusion protein)